MGGLIYFLVIGVIAGSLAGRIMKGQGFGLVGDLVVGCIGAVIGGFLLPIFGIVTIGIIGNLIAATLGGMVLLFIVRRWR